MSLAKVSFTSDNFSSRRTTGNNLYDPESLLTGEEAAAGYTYDNSIRVWPDEQTYLEVCHGEIPARLVSKIAPRHFKVTSPVAVAIAPLRAHDHVQTISRATYQLLRDAFSLDETN